MVHFVLWFKLQRNLTVVFDDFCVVCVGQCSTMTSLKTWYLLFLAAFLFLSTVPTVAEVVKSVELCDQFFLDGNPPQVPGILEGGNIVNQNQYKAICQTYANEKRFVTLYDIKNKIPVFSAYKYRGQEGGKRPPNRWNIEPQVCFKSFLTDLITAILYFGCKKLLLVHIHSKSATTIGY